MHKGTQISNNDRGPERRRFVTLRGMYGHDEVDLEMPGDLEVGSLIPELIKALNWPISEGSRPLRYQLKTESGEVMDESATLSDAGVENSDVLWITLAEEVEHSDDEQPAERDEFYLPDEGPVRGFAPVAATSPSPKDRRGTLEPPRAVRLPIEEPSLISPGGIIFVLGKSPVTIGRASRGHQPDVDLSEIDTEIISSRRHLEIHMEENGYFLIPQQTTNGTFVNGIEIPRGEQHILEDGDRIQFGFEGVELTFWSGRKGDLPASFFR